MYTYDIVYDIQVVHMNIVYDIAYNILYYDLYDIVCYMRFHMESFSSSHGTSLQFT